MGSPPTFESQQLKLWDSLPYIFPPLLFCLPVFFGSAVCQTGPFICICCSTSLEPVPLPDVSVFLLPVDMNVRISWVGVKNFGFTEKQKNIEQGSGGYPGPGGVQGQSPGKGSDGAKSPI